MIVSNGRNVEGRQRMAVIATFYLNDETTILSIKSNNDEAAPKMEDISLSINHAVTGKSINSFRPVFVSLENNILSLELKRIKPAPPKCSLSVTWSTRGESDNIMIFDHFWPPPPVALDLGNKIFPVCERGKFLGYFHLYGPEPVVITPSLSDYEELTLPTPLSMESRFHLTLLLPNDKRQPRFFYRIHGDEGITTTLLIRTPPYEDIIWRLKFAPDHSIPFTPKDINGLIQRAKNIFPLNNNLSYSHILFTIASRM